MNIPCQVQPVDINTVRGLEIVILLRSIIIPRGVGDDRLQSVDRVVGFVLGQAVAFQRIGNVKLGLAPDDVFVNLFSICIGTSDLCKLYDGRV